MMSPKMRMISKYPFWCFYLNLLLFACHSPAQKAAAKSSGVEDGLVEKLVLANEPKKTFTLEERMSHYQTPGFSIAIVKSGKIVLAKGYGQKNKKGDPVNSETLFQAASISKPVTALGVLKLVQTGKVDLDVPINQYLKEYQLEDNEFTKTNKVTLRRLLTHTAGLNLGGFGGYLQNEELPSTIDVLLGIGNSPKLEVVEEPGTRWNYSGGGYVLVQKIIEDVTGLSFEVYMETEILKPLGMRRSTFQQPIDSKWQQNLSHAFDAEGNPIDGNWHNYAAKGAGGLWTTPSDLGKWFTGLHNAYMKKDTTIFSKQTIELMLTKHLRDWGLGPMIINEGKDIILTHDGSNAGFKADFFGYIKSGNAVIAMGNAERSSDLCLEYMLSVCSHYGWNARKQRAIHPIILKNDSLLRYQGVYRWIDRSSYSVEIQLKNEQLHLAYADDGESRLLPLEMIDLENTLNIETGQTVQFRIGENGQPTGLLWRNRFEFVKE